MEMSCILYGMEHAQNDAIAEWEFKSGFSRISHESDKRLKLQNNNNNNDVPPEAKNVLIFHLIWEVFEILSSM